MPGQETDRLIDEVSRQVVAAFERSGCIDARIVEHELWSVLVGFRIHESIEAIEAAPERPAVERTRCAGFSQRRDVPLAHHVVAVGMGSQHLGERSGLLCDLAAIAGKTAVEVRKAADTDGVVIAPRQQGRARRRAHGRGVEARVAQPLRCQTIDRRRLDRRAVATKIREADIIEEHNEDIRRAKRRFGLRWPPGRRLLDGRADLALRMDGFACSGTVLSSDSASRANRISLRLDVGGLDDRPPLLDLGLLQCAKRLGRLLLARENLLAKIGEPRTHRRIGQGINDRGIELGDRRLIGVPLGAQSACQADM